MHYIYESDEKGATQAGWDTSPTIFETMFDGMVSSFHLQSVSRTLPKSAEEMSANFPRRTGLRCDKDFVQKHFVVGDDPIKVPYGSLPEGITPRPELESYDSLSAVGTLADTKNLSAMESEGLKPLVKPMESTLQDLQKGQQRAVFMTGSGVRV